MKLDAAEIKEMLLYISNKLIANEDKLCKIDSQIGDGDHGHTMARAFKAARDNLQEKENLKINDLFKLVGKSLISKGGGASGPLFGSIFLQFASIAAENKELGRSEFAEMFAEALQAVKSRGQVEEGDKTMVDALAPAAQALTEANEEELDLRAALTKASEAAQAGVESTREMVAKKGRAKFIQERAQGYQDAGATSVYLIVAGMKEYLEEV